MKKTKDRKTGKMQEFVDDSGVEDKRLMLYEPELAQLLRVMTREGNTVSAVIRRAWDGGDLVV